MPRDHEISECIQTAFALQCRASRLRCLLCERLDLIRHIRRTQPHISLPNRLIRFAKQSIYQNGGAIGSWESHSSNARSYARSLLESPAGQARPRLCVYIGSGKETAPCVAAAAVGATSTSFAPRSSLPSKLLSLGDSGGCHWICATHWPSPMGNGTHKSQPSTGSKRAAARAKAAETRLDVHGVSQAFVGIGPGGRWQAEPPGSAR